MNLILLVILLLVTLAMIGIILLQRSEGGGLGGASPSMGGMTARGTANLLTKTTAVLATIFMSLCIILAIMNGRTKIVSEASLIDKIAQDSEQQKPLDVPLNK
ncbi:MAG: preprotein translocase subunit SecG [Alphaproteobacteria bacterium]